ncbi:uncharacterized protein [Chironomus tepperi]|uniref:uncharacterized protein n=1 Tax=Chironomus tepperi TaxID=113505 RepID=UPI00391F1220
MNTLLFFSCVVIITGYVNSANLEITKQIHQKIGRVKPKRCYPITSEMFTSTSTGTTETTSSIYSSENITTVLSSVTTTQAPTTPFASAWPSNQDLRAQISEAILKYGGNLTDSEYQALMDTSKDINTFAQYLNSTQMLILIPFFGQTLVSQAISHNSSDLPTTIIYDIELQQNITQTFQQYAPNMSPDEIQFVINTMQTMSTITVNSLTLDELTQMAQACASAFINNTLNNGPIITTTVSSTTTTTTQAPTTPFASPWPSNQDLRVQISEAILKYGGNLTDSEYQALMDTSKDINTFAQYLNSTQMLILIPFFGQTLVSQAISHNSSDLPTTIIYDIELQQNITQTFQQYAPNMSPDEIQFVINTMQTMSTITVNSLTLDELTQMAQACASAFINNTLNNGPILTTTVSSTTTTTTQAPTTPFASPWPSNQDLRVQISEAILKYGGNLTDSEYQALMDTSKDINTFAQYLNSTQMLILIPFFGQTLVSQAISHNSSDLPTTIIYDIELQQNITQTFQQYAPNMSPDEIQFVINTMQTMSTITVNSLTLDELTQMAQACASAFINNTLNNGPIITTTVSSTTTSTTQTPTSTSSTTYSSTTTVPSITTSTLSPAINQQLTNSISSLAPGLNQTQIQNLLNATYSSTTTVPSITTSTLSPAINQQLTNSISSLAPGLNQTQIQNLLNAIQVLANTYYFTPAQTIIIAPGLSFFFMYHSGSSVTINGTTAVYTAADVLSLVSFFNLWVPAMTGADIQEYITKMEAVSYYSQGVTPLEALSLAPALAQIFINQASSQTAAP